MYIEYNSNSLLFSLVYRNDQRLSLLCILLEESPITRQFMTR